MATSPGGWHKGVKRVLKRIGSWYVGLSPTVQIALIVAITVVVVVSLMLGGDMTDVSKTLLETP